MDSVLPIGIGQREFDEHRSLDSSDRIPDECAATLVAKGLEIPLINETLKRMIQYSLLHDQKGISISGLIPSFETDTEKN